MQEQMSWEGHMCLCVGSCQRCQDVNQDKSWWPGLCHLCSSVPGATGMERLAGLGEGGGGWQPSWSCGWERAIS